MSIERSQIGRRTCYRIATAVAWHREIPSADVAFDRRHSGLKIPVSLVRFRVRAPVGRSGGSSHSVSGAVFVRWPARAPNSEWPRAGGPRYLETARVQHCTRDTGCRGLSRLRGSGRCSRATDRRRWRNIRLAGDGGHRTRRGRDRIDGVGPALATSQGLPHATPVAARDPSRVLNRYWPTTPPALRAVDTACSDSGFPSPRRRRRSRSPVAFGRWLSSSSRFSSLARTRIVCTRRRSSPLRRFSARSRPDGSSSSRSSKCSPSAACTLHGSAPPMCLHGTPGRSHVRSAGQGKAGQGKPACCERRKRESSKRHLPTHRSLNGVSEKLLECRSPRSSHGAYGDETARTTASAMSSG